MKQRLDYLDLTKALAIILVVIGHVIYFCIYSITYLDDCSLGLYVCRKNHTFKSNNKLNDIL